MGSPGLARNSQRLHFKEEVYCVGAICETAWSYPCAREQPGTMPLILAQQKTRFLIIAAAVLLCVLAGCGHPKIIGKWRMSGSSSATIWEFSENGAVLVGDVRGRYRFGDQDRIKIETPFATTVYQMKISGDHLVLQEPGGSRLEFTRMR
ncbi:MAG: hypothetical protein DMF21_01365 [Verrucomicrobia bacterium]|nr:MAG: hypothetical protein DMF09_07455 [Verrucomicrobiota bacterium]PYL82789.1 MAG: hypothetical protein DMF21_01365 [Verrucomicrobiota bacterium]